MFYLKSNGGRVSVGMYGRRAEFCLPGGGVGRLGARNDAAREAEVQVIHGS